MEFLLNFNTWYKNLPAGGKLSLYLVVIGAVCAALLLQSHYKFSGYQYLYTNLSLTDANAIAERLQSMNVDVKIQGDAVLVPGNKVLELRNQLASEGLPRGGGVGFEIFDQKNFGETEFQQRINYIRAVQGELSRTISAIDGVEKARVHLVMPEKSLFAEDSKQPTASVALSMFKGRKLSDSQVSGIVHMVVTSVEGLTEANITVTDQNSNILFRGQSDDKAGMSAKNLEVQSAYEAKLAKSVTEMLERVVGPNGASVKISSTMNFAMNEKTIEAVDPESRVALSEQTSTETSAGSSGAPGGAPGAAANLPEGGGSSSSLSRSDSSKRTETTSTYGVTKTMQKILEPTGTVQKLSVAVLVDGTYKAKEDGTKEYTARTPEEMAKLEDLVKKAIGFNQQRGDEVKIENMPFLKEEGPDVPQEQFVAATNSSRWTLFLLDNGKLMGVVLILGIIFFMLVKLVNSYSPPISVAYANMIGQEAGQLAAALPAKAAINIVRKESPEAKAQQAQLAQQLPEVNLKRGPAGEINFVETNKSITVEAIETSEEKLRLQAAKMQAEAIIKSDTNEAVQVIKAWVAED